MKLHQFTRFIRVIKAYYITRDVMLLRLDILVNGVQHSITAPIILHKHTPSESSLYNRLSKRLYQHARKAPLKHCVQPEMPEGLAPHLFTWGNV